MNLPLRLLSTAPEEPVLSVDGAFGAPGLELSHWPGNKTPFALKHDLSTGCVLNWARMGRVEREDLARGCTAIANNHYDTDGVMAMYAARHPDDALERSGDLLDAAAAGDFFRIPSERALALDAIVENFGDPERSPIARKLYDLEGLARRELCVRHLVEELPAMLDEKELPWPELWQPKVKAAHADRQDLASCERAEHPELDLCVWIADESAASTREGAASGAFDPGRHALFQEAQSDRVLVLAPAPGGGTAARLIVSTLSWFDLPSHAPLPRPDLEALAAKLNELEDVLPEHEAAWRAQARTNASPELWFGTEELASFAEHSPALRQSRLAPEDVREAVIEALT